METFGTIGMSFGIIGLVFAMSALNHYWFWIYSRPCTLDRNYSIDL
jgi:hypothetical protein